MVKFVETEGDTWISNEKRWIYIINSLSEKDVDRWHEGGIEV